MIMEHGLSTLETVRESEIARFQRTIGEGLDLKKVFSDKKIEKLIKDSILCYLAKKNDKKHLKIQLKELADMEERDPRMFEENVRKYFFGKPFTGSGTIMGLKRFLILNRR